jgi:hypothetical protein
LLRGMRKSMTWLLDRQNSLLAYLTSRGAVLGESSGVSCDNMLGPIDPGLLRLEARFSFEKRMAKIAAILPRTFHIVGGIDSATVADFVDACPPCSLASLDNAHQFHDFLVAKWRRESPAPPYLPDVAACELACAEVRIGAHSTLPRISDTARPGSIRRTAGTVLRRCAYDVRALFEGEQTVNPPRRETLLVIVNVEDRTVVAEITPAVFDILSLLDDFTDPLTIEAFPQSAEIIAALDANGFIEVAK